MAFFWSYREPVPVEDPDDHIKSEMWDEQRQRYSVNVMAICGQCGGSSMSSCGCARKRFENNLTRANIVEYKRRCRQKYEAQLAAVDENLAVAKINLEKQYQAQKDALQGLVVKYSSN